MTRLPRLSGTGLGSALDRVGVAENTATYRARSCRQGRNVALEAVLVSACAVWSSVALGQPIAITAVPVGNHASGALDPGVTIVGNEMFMPSGGRRVLIDFRIGDFDPTDSGNVLKAFAVKPDPNSYASGVQGTLTNAAFPCANDGECVAELGVGEQCDTPPNCLSGGGPCTCNPVFIDGTRGSPNPFVLAGSAALCATGSDEINYRVYCATIGASASDPEPFPAGGLYAGTLVLDVPADAAGTFTISLLPGETNLIDGNNLPYEVQLIPARITLPTPPPRGRCCHNIGPGTGDCTDDVTQSECDALPRGVGANVLVADATCLGDVDEDGVDDSCPTCAVAAAPAIAQIDSNAGSSVSLVDMTNNRTLALRVPGSAGRPQAVRVHFKTLPPPWDIWNGRRMWVAEPVQLCELSGVGLGGICPPSFGRSWTAGLTCNPAAAGFVDWNALGTVYVFHPGIIPSDHVRTPIDAEYELQAVDSTCDIGNEAMFSPVKSVVMARWGNIAGPYDSAGGYYTAADNSVDITVDVIASISKFANRPGAPSKARVIVDACRLNFTVDAQDFTWVLDAFRGQYYPFTFATGGFHCFSMDPCDYPPP